MDDLASIAGDFSAGNQYRFFRNIEPVNLSKFGSLNSGDRLRYLQATAIQDAELGRLAAANAEAELAEIQANRSVEALQNEAAVLDELITLDPFENGFEKKAGQYSQMASLSPAIRGALGAKLDQREAFHEALEDHTNSAAAAGLDDETFLAQREEIKTLIRSGNMEDYQRLLLSNDRLARTKAIDDRKEAIRADYQIRKELSNDPEVLAERQAAAEAKYMRDMQDEHYENLSKIEVPELARAQNQEWFHGSMAGDRQHLYQVVTDYVTETALSSLFTRDGGMRFMGLDGIEHVLAGAAGFQNGAELVDHLKSDPEAEAWFAQLSENALSMNETAFVARYAQAPAAADSLTGQAEGPTKDEVARTKEFLKGLHKEVTAIRDFSDEMSRFRSRNPEFQRQAMEEEEARKAAAQKEYEERMRALQDWVSEILSEAFDE